MISDFLTNDETGAVTVDWVVLTAATVGMALAMMTLVRGGVETSVDNIDAHLNAPSVIVRMYHGFGYTPHNEGQFRSLLLDVAALDESDLAQMAAYSNELNGLVADDTDPNFAGQVADFNVAVDMAYADAGLTRPDGTEYDEVELARISSEMGYDELAMVGG